MKPLIDLVAKFAALRFAIIGACGVPVDAGTLWLMLNIAHAPYPLATPVAWFCAASFTWVGNRYFTFGARRAHGVWPVVQEWLRFLAANGVGGLISVGISITVHALAPAPLNNPYIARACGVLVGLVFNFTLSKKLVFKGPI